MNKGIMLSRVTTMQQTDEQTYNYGIPGYQECNEMTNKHAIVLSPGTKSVLDTDSIPG